MNKIRIISSEKEIITSVQINEKRSRIPWDSLTQTNALETVSKATALLYAPAVGYIRTDLNGEVKQEHLYTLRRSNCPRARVQFDSDSNVSTHWISVELPIDNDDEPHYITIHEGQRFYIPIDLKFLAIESTNLISDIDGPARGEQPMTIYEIYAPFGG